MNNMNIYKKVFYLFNIFQIFNSCSVKASISLSSISSISLPVHKTEDQDYFITNFLLPEIDSKHDIREPWTNTPRVDNNNHIISHTEDCIITHKIYPNQIFPFDEISLNKEEQFKYLDCFSLKSSEFMRETESKDESFRF